MIEVICSSVSATSRPSGARMAKISDWPMPVAISAAIRISRRPRTLSAGAPSRIRAHLQRGENAPQQPRIIEIAHGIDKPA